MTFWLQRMAEATSARAGHDNGANSASCSTEAAIGSIGTSGTDDRGIGTLSTLGQPALAALLAHGSGPNLPCPTDIAERAAVLSNANGLSKEEAAAAALLEHGFISWESFATAHCRRISIAINVVPALRNQAGIQLRNETRRFITSPWPAEAVALGWSLEDLFGIAANAPLVRVGEHGLVTSLALSPVGGELEALLDDRAMIRLPSGARQTYSRFLPAMDAAVLWWKCPALIAE